LAVLSIPKPGQHIVALGSTGSGKSEFMQRLLTTQNNYLAIDTQDSLDRLNAPSFSDPHGLNVRLKLYKKLKYKPGNAYRERDWWNYVIATLANSSTKKKPKPRTVYIDEIYHIGYGSSFPAELPKALTTCRQKKISWWISSQRPRQIPVPVISESSKIYVFYLSKYDDMKYISGFGRQDPKELMQELQKLSDDYSFIEIDNRKGTWTKFPPIKV